MKHYFNVCDVRGNGIEPVDIITFGSPCQDLSIAGKRAGLKHAENGDEETTRSGLFMEAVRIIKEMRNATNNDRPRFAVWENVLGAFSSGKGEDFRIVLEELAKIKDPTVSIPRPKDGKWRNAGEIVGNGFSIAWRVLDAQHWGVPQRRRRIYLVADFGGGSAGKILFESESVSGDTAPSETPWKRTAGNVEGGIGKAILFEPRSQDGEPRIHENGISPTLNTSQGGQRQPCVALRAQPDGSTGGNVVVEGGIRAAGFKWGQGAQARSIGYSEEVSPTLPATAGGNTAPAIVRYKEPTAFSFDSISSNSMKSSNPHSGCREVDVAKCLDTTDPNPSKNQGGVAVVQLCGDRDNPSVSWSDKAYCLPANPMSDRGQAVVQPQTLKIRSGCDGGGKGALIQDNLSATLGCNNDQTLFVPTYCLQGNGIDRADTAGCNGKGWTEDVCYTLNTFDRPAVYAQDAYDKLTETEQSATLRAKGENYGGGTENLCATNMTVRRLTPTECARLQGFPDEWGKLPKITEMTDEDYQFWTECRKAKATIDGKKFQPKTKEQTIKWYNKLHTDSAEYKMWGNGIALPCASYVLSGIANEGAKTLGSLFDGSGGFPIAGLIHGIKPLYSCEVEPYPVAVTKARFNQIK
jgi:DNA (cytosine-5)-methyltransferase 1